MTPALPLTAGVVGAGIAGLSVAIALRRAGAEVEVYERSQFKNEIGAAISAPPNAAAALRRWGFDFVAAKTVPNLSTRYAAAEDLETTFESRYEDIEDVMGSPCLSFHRVDLHGGLRALATEEEGGDTEESRKGGGKGKPVAIHLGCEVQNVDCENGVLELAGGRRVQKDLVIIADGAHSKLLTDFLGYQAPVQPTGRSIYRWLVSMDEVMANPELAPHYRDKAPGFLGWFDAQNRILWVTYTCRGGTVLNNAVVYDTAVPKNEEGRNGNEKDMSWHAPAATDTVLATLSNFHPAALGIVSMASEDGIVEHRLFHRPPLESFVRGRTAVIGDVAHVMMPTHAAGAAIAIESASVLEVLFKDLGSQLRSTARDQQGFDVEKERIVKERLRLFDKLRIPRCNLTMLVSNAGPEGLRRPGLEKEIRRFYHGPLPPSDALPWGDEFREVLFHYDAFLEAEKALRNRTSEKEK
ncbi:FAD/NAD(P)-binding domain-containing protein [Xylaria bambusicola]|uniref:FAD/NAD(P)-binding domain-containing protein n=1 Tax=Xylaria bambusicola TaxID=326684 RepID=UPI00200723B3|nr:FAD/NAD(P)-binding domain-containing protein [Xylaria bambusicola]KAI0527874.1 FAD/NAD(P)-binding domain-containing protein [Xylaria bambusicola]